MFPFVRRIICHQNPNVSRICRLRFVSSMETNKVIVIEDSEITPTIKMSFSYTDKNKNVKRRFEVDRKPSENYNISLERISNKVSQFLKKKKCEIHEIPVSIVSKSSDLCFEESSTCKEIFTNNGYQLMVGENSYDFVVNPPRVSCLKLPKLMLAGYMIVPSKFKTANCEEKGVNFEWYISEQRFEVFSDAGRKDGAQLKWILAGKDPYLITSKKDVGKVVKLVVKPAGEDSLMTTTVFCSSLIQMGPERCPFEDRHQFTETPCDASTVRLVTYNTLAEMYSNSEYARSVLFSTCPKHALDIEYRLPLIIKELLGYNADVMCLQETDSKVFANEYQVVFTREGFSLHFGPKSAGTCKEGVVTMFKKDKFRLIETEVHALEEVLRTTESLKDFSCKLQWNDELWTNILQRNTVLQVTVLQSIANEQQLLVIGNTHLYSRGDADNIRIIQFYTFLQILKQTVQKYQQMFPTKNVCRIFAGDFNSSPADAIFRFVHNKIIHENDVDWKSIKEQEVTDIKLTHDWNLSSAYGAPAFTNYVLNFQACLDYIFYDTDHLTLKQTVPLPTLEQITEHIALPSPVIPSDHLALIADFNWKK